MLDEAREGREKKEKTVPKRGANRVDPIPLVARPIYIYIYTRIYVYAVTDSLSRMDGLLVFPCTISSLALPRSIARDRRSSVVDESDDRFPRDDIRSLGLGTAGARMQRLV